MRFEFPIRVPVDMADLFHFEEIEHGLADFQPQWRVSLLDAQQVGLGSYEGYKRGHQLFTYRINRRIGHLREQLLKIVIQGLVFG